jgi:peptidyl-prolyl cis-trans isomerase B (cyclophilin B)
VVEGMDIVDKISETPVDAKDKPEEDVIIKGIKVIK